VLVHRLPHGRDIPLPAPATPGSAGADLRSAAPATVEIPPGGWRPIPTGLVLEIPDGWEGQVRPRSGLASRHGVTVLNSPGTIDSDYRGEVVVLLINHGASPYRVERGDRIAQLVIAAVAAPRWQEVAATGSTGRGGGGFGSTGSS